MADEKAPDKAPELITGDVYVATKSFASSALDDDDARAQFVEGHKGRIKVDTVTLADKQHVVGTGITYTFSAEAK